MEPHEFVVYFVGLHVLSYLMSCLIDQPISSWNTTRVVEMTAPILSGELHHIDECIISMNAYSNRGLYK